MNFNWKNDIYKDDEYPSNNTPKSSNKDAELILLPRFCKIIGIGIAFSPVLFKISQLYYPVSFTRSVYISDLKLLFILMFGLAIEAISKAKVVTEETFYARSAALLVMFIISIYYLMPFLPMLWDLLW